MSGKSYQKLFEICVVKKFADAAENPRMLMNLHSEGYVVKI